MHVHNVHINPRHILYGFMVFHTSISLRPTDSVQQITPKLQGFAWENLKAARQLNLSRGCSRSWMPLVSNGVNFASRHFKIV